jgi:hypothetical protein
MREVVSIALVLISGFGAFALMRWLPSMVENRMDPFDDLLERAGVEPDGRIRNRLQPQAARRQVWGAVGAGVVAVTFAVRKHPNSLPVTHRLAVRTRAA